MAVEDNRDQPPRNLMGRLLEIVRKNYIEEHGEEPPEEFMQRARDEIVHDVASKDREEHRDIYEALANE